jgi:hypothetical protein
MIGYLVAFEKKAKTMEVCCDLQNDATKGSESISSYGQHIRYARSIPRSQRGRMRDSVTTRSACMPQSIAMTTDINCIAEDVIVAKSDVVEVIMNTLDGNLSEGDENLGLTCSSFHCTMPAEFASPIHKLVKCEGKSGESFDNFHFKTVSLESPLLKLEAFDERRIKEVSSNKFNHAAKTQIFHKTSMMPPCRILGQQQQQLNVVEKEVFREVNTDQKTVGVIFRDPIYEVIPFQQSFAVPESDFFSEYNLGDEVEIVDGIYRRKIGRILKILGDVVQVEMANIKPKLLYISPKKLQPLHGGMLMA